MKRRIFYTTALVTLSLLSAPFSGQIYASEQTVRTPEVVQGEIAALEALPSSRVNNTKIQNLQKELLALQSGGEQVMPSPPTPSPLLTSPQPTTSTVPSPHATPSPLLTSPQPTTSTVRTPEVVQGEIAALEALPSSRVSNLKIQNLQKELLALQSGGEQVVPSPHPTPSPLLTGPQPTTSTVPSPHPTPSPLLGGSQASSISAPSASAELNALSDEFNQLTKNQNGTKRKVTLNDIDDFLTKVVGLQRDVLSTHTKSLSSIEGHALDSLHQQALLVKTTAAHEDVAQKSVDADLGRQQKITNLNTKIATMQTYVQRGGEGGLLSKRFGKLGIQEKAAAHTVATEAIALIDELLVSPKDDLQKKNLKIQKKMFESDLSELNR